jgi:hypothetical protein
MRECCDTGEPIGSSRRALSNELGDVSISAAEVWNLTELGTGNLSALKRLGEAVIKQVLE